VAVYTHLGAEDLARLIAQYDVGELVSAKGIAEGVSNSNWLVETTGAEGSGARFILTLYERRIDYADLPYFLDLLDHRFPEFRVHDFRPSVLVVLELSGLVGIFQRVVVRIEVAPSAVGVVARSREH
jgi:Ser/Thr protein kinase RdoA (MazF antagonist)